MNCLILNEEELRTVSGGRLIGLPTRLPVQALKSPVIHIVGTHAIRVGGCHAQLVAGEPHICTP